MWKGRENFTNTRHLRELHNRGFIPPKRADVFRADHQEKEKHSRKQNNEKKLSRPYDVDLARRGRILGWRWTLFGHAFYLKEESEHADANQRIKRPILGLKSIDICGIEPAAQRTERPVKMQRIKNDRDET